MKNKIDWDTYEVKEGTDFELGEIQMYLDQVQEEIVRITDAGREVSLELETLMEILGELESEEAHV